MKYEELVTYLIGGILLTSIHSVYANEMGTVQENLQSTEELELLELLEEQTDIATKTHMNADFVPGMVTVLLGNELEKMGIHSVWQALGTVPGMEIGIDQIGGRTVKVRGIGGSFASGNLKIMLNNVPMNSGLSALGQPIMNMPIMQIDRIEIIRGPGSAVHGEFAYAGVVNVITQVGSKNIYTGIGENQSRLIGGNYHWDVPEKNIKADLNIAFSKTEGDSPYVDSDALFLSGTAIGIGQAGVSNAPGTVNQGRGYKSVLFNMVMHDYKLKAQWLNDEHDAHFGTLNVLSREEDNYDNEFKTLELKRTFSWTDSLSANVQIGWLEYINKYDAEILPAGFGLWHYPSFPLVLENGYLSEGYFKENKYYAGIDMFWELSSQHKLLVGINYSKSKVKDAWQKNNIHPNVSFSGADDFALSSPQKFSGDDPINWPRKGTKRELTSITIQDEYQPIEDWLFTAGIRFDHYSDVKSNVSPRIAAVYHFNEKHIFKGQYAQAFRPPTFFETIWTPELDPQTINTFDLGYLYKGKQIDIRLTLFHSKLKNIITSINPLGYTNAKGATVYGSEFEIEHHLNEKIKINANLSYAKSEDDETEEPIARTSEWLANLMLMYHPTSQYDMSLRYHYIGESYREVGDPRDKLDGYGVTNIVLSINDVLSKGSILQFGVDNLFNEDVRYAAPMATDVLGVSFPSYENDYPRQGRYWWLRLKYQFN